MYKISMLRKLRGLMKTVIAEGSVIAQDQSRRGNTNDRWGQSPASHEKLKLVRSCVIRCLSLYGCESLCKGDQEDFAEQQTQTAWQGRRKGNGQAAHGDVRHATQVICREAIVTKKAALIRDARGACKGTRRGDAGEIIMPGSLII